jgi:hypothetical protein
VPRTDRRTHEIREDLFGDIARTISSAYARKLKETLRRAIDDGYDGVDVVHDEVEFLFEGPRTSAWRAKKWCDEPSSTPDESYQRYDFRYYDRESLLRFLETEEWPEDEPEP